MVQKCKWFSVNLDKEIIGEVLTKTKYTVKILLVDGNVIKRKIRQVEFI